MIYSLPSEVHGGVITVGGRRLLEEGGVRVFYAEEVEAVKVKDGRIYCPFEGMVQGISDPEEAYKAIEARMGRL
jgi:phytoene dehydrogenase-like protein